MTPLPIPDRTPPVTTTILRSALSVSATSVSSVGGRLARRKLGTFVGCRGMVEKE